MNIINILLNIIFVCIFGQFATITHEFGHAIPALLFAKDKVIITFGNATIKTKKINFNRLCIEIGGFQPFLGFANYNGDRLTDDDVEKLTIEGMDVLIINVTRAKL